MGNTDRPLPASSLEFEFRPCPSNGLPYISEARSLATAGRELVVHNYEAADVLRRLIPLLAPGGFILIGDYIQTFIIPEHKSGALLPPPYQRYGGATAIGLNVDLLKKCFDGLSGLLWAEPLEDNEHLHSRMLASEPAQATVQQFKSRFSKNLYDWTHQPSQTARELVRGGRYDSAMASFREALVRQPSNWVLCQEVAGTSSRETSSNRRKVSSRLPCA